MDTQTQQGSNNKETVTPKEIFVVNDYDGFKFFLSKLDHFAKNQMQIAIDPYITLEQVFAEVRQKNYFMTVEYNPDTMSHRIAKVMPQMTDIADTMGGEYSDPSKAKVTSQSFEYPEK